jgi:hypothetical protein
MWRREKHHTQHWKLMKLDNMQVWLYRKISKNFTLSCQPMVPLTTRSTNLVLLMSLIIGGSSTTYKPKSKAYSTSLAVFHDTFAPMISAMSWNIMHDITRITSVNNIRRKSCQLSCDVSYKCLVFKLSMCCIDRNKNIMIYSTRKRHNRSSGRKP